MDNFIFFAVVSCIAVVFAVAVQCAYNTGYREGREVSTDHTAAQAYRFGYRDCMKLP